LDERTLKDSINTFDIIIPVYKPGESFLRLLQMLKVQGRPFRKLIIINTVPDEAACNFENSGSTGKDSNSDRTLWFIKQVFEDSSSYIYKCISQSEFDHAGTRKAAAALSEADAFICMTDDAVPDDKYLTTKLIGALETDEKTAIAYGRQLPREGAGSIERYTRKFNYPAKDSVKTIDDIDRLGIKTFFASNVCCAYKKRIYDELGGFTDTAIFNEDMIYAAKALKNGYISRYVSAARVIHSHSYTAMQQLHRNFDLGMSQAMNPEVFDGIASEGEGIRLVKNTAAWLIKNHAAKELPELIISSGFKYIGFRLGKAYRKIPDRAMLFLAMNKSYAKKIIKQRRNG